MKKYLYIILFVGVCFGQDVLVLKTNEKYEGKYLGINLFDVSFMPEKTKFAQNIPIKKSPVLEAIKKYPQRISLAAGAFLSVQVTFYILIAFILTYGEKSTNLVRDDMLSAVLIGSAIMVPFLFLFSSYSDRNGRRGIFMLGSILTAIWAFALFPLVDTGNFWIAVVAISVGLVFLAMMYGPQAAFFAELFSTEVRYSGANLGYQLGAILGGAFAPTIALFG